MPTALPHPAPTPPPPQTPPHNAPTMPVVRSPSVTAVAVGPTTPNPSPPPTINATLPAEPHSHTHANTIVNTNLQLLPNTPTTNTATTTPAATAAAAATLAAATLATATIAAPPTAAATSESAVAPPRPPQNPPAVKPPPRIIAEHFNTSSYKLDTVSGYVEATCIHCSATIKGQKNVTSNFIQHTRRRHPDAYAQYVADSAPRAKRPRLSASTRPPPSQSRQQSLKKNALTATSGTTTTTSSIPMATTGKSTAPNNKNPHTKASPQHSGDNNNTSLSHSLLGTVLLSPALQAIPRTQCNIAPTLSSRLHNSIYLKRDDLQPGNTVHFRAAYHLLSTMQPPPPSAGIITTGPAASAVAAAAAALNVQCSVVAPPSVPSGISRLAAASSAELLSRGETYRDAAAFARKLSSDTKRPLVDLSSGPLPTNASTLPLMTGYATLALEIVQQKPALDFVFLPAGNTALLAAVSIILQQLAPTVRVVAVVDTSGRTGVSCDGDAAGSTATGGGEAGADVAQPPHAHHVVSVTREDIILAIGSIFADCGVIVENCGAICIAGVTRFLQGRETMNGKRCVAVVDTPVRSLDGLVPTLGRLRRLEGSQCMLVVHAPRGAAPTLPAFVRQLRRVHWGVVRVFRLRFSGRWPLLLGLWCDDAATTARSHVASLSALGYRAEDVSTAEIDEGDVGWGEGGDVDEGGRGDWGVFKVTVVDDGKSVCRFLEVERAGVALRRVSFRCDGSGMGTVLVAARGGELQLGELEIEMRKGALSVRRVRGVVGGIRVLGVGEMDNGNKAAGGVGHSGGVSVGVGASVNGGGGGDGGDGGDDGEEGATNGVDVRMIDGRRNGASSMVVDGGVGVASAVEGGSVQAVAVPHAGGEGREMEIDRTAVEKEQTMTTTTDGVVDVDEVP